MNKDEILKKITLKKEFSELPEKDLEMIFSKFNKYNYSDEEKVKLTRDFLRKIFSGFASNKLLNIRQRSEDWILKKHLSTRERFNYYLEIYQKILKITNEKNISVIDLGAGVNGFSYKYFLETGFNVKYIGVEGVGQLVNLMNYYFKNKRFNAKAYHLSLFEIEKIIKLLKKQKKPRIVFLLKVIDSLELVQKDYSKRLISEIIDFSDFIVLSFAEKSMLKKISFKAKRYWIINFIEKNYLIKNSFSFSGEKYIVFCKR